MARKISNRKTIEGRSKAKKVVRINKLSKAKAKKKRDRQRQPRPYLLCKIKKKKRKLKNLVMSRRRMPARLW